MNNTEEEWHAAMVAKGHYPKMDGGKIDMFAMDDNHAHSGPMCETCYWCCCAWCDDVTTIPECTSPVITIEATKLVP